MGSSVKQFAINWRDAIRSNPIPFFGTFLVGVTLGLVFAGLMF